MRGAIAIRAGPRMRELLDGMGQVRYDIGTFAGLDRRRRGVRRWRLVRPEPLGNDQRPTASRTADRQDCPESQALGPSASRSCTFEASQHVKVASGEKNASGHRAGADGPNVDRHLSRKTLVFRRALMGVQWKAGRGRSRDGAA
jgi:hypothetical protein